MRLISNLVVTETFALGACARSPSHIRRRGQNVEAGSRSVRKRRPRKDILKIFPLVAAWALQPGNTPEGAGEGLYPSPAVSEGRGLLLAGAQKLRRAGAGSDRTLERQAVRAQ